MLWTMRKLRLRWHDGPPEGHEILIPLLVWSAMFEVWLPHTRMLGDMMAADPHDVLCYTVGAVVATCFWRTWYRDEGKSVLTGVDLSS